MGTTELLNVDPLELKFPFELKKQISCSIQLSNKTENHVAFKVKTTNPKKYCVRPNTGIVLPRSTCDVIVTMQAQKEAPPDMQCKDKFLLQSVAAPPGTTPKDITSEMFSKNSGRLIEECKLKVVYLPPPQPPSPVLEDPNEGISPKVSFTESTNLNSSQPSANTNTSQTSANLNSSQPSANLNPSQPSANLNSSQPSANLNSSQPSAKLNPSQSFEAPRQYVDSNDKLLDARSIITKLVEEKNVANQKSNKVQQEMKVVARGSNKSQGSGVSIMVVVAICVIGLLVGYLMKN